MPTTLPMKYDIKINAGTTYTKAFAWKPDGTTPAVFTGWTARMWVQSPGFASHVAYTSSDNTLALNSYGEVIIAFTALQTKAMLPDSYQYNVDLIDAAGKVTPFLQGRMKVSKGARSFT